MPHNINYDISFLFIFTGKGYRADIKNTAFKKYSVPCTFTINAFLLLTNK